MRPTRWLQVLGLVAVLPALCLPSAAESLVKPPSQGVILVVLPGNAGASLAGIRSLVPAELRGKVAWGLLTMAPLSHASATDLARAIGGQSWLGENMRNAGVRRTLLLRAGVPSRAKPLLDDRRMRPGKILYAAGSVPTWSFAARNAGLMLMEIPPGTASSEIVKLLGSLAKTPGTIWLISLQAENGCLFPCGRYRTGQDGGVLFSASTHTAGLYIPPDLTADLAASLGLPAPILGGPLLSKPLPFQHVVKLSKQLEAGARYRKPLLIVLGMLLLIIAVLFGFLAWAGCRKTAVFVLALLACLPAVFALVPVTYGYAAIFICLSAAALLAILCQAAAGERAPLFTGALVSLLILFDVICGSPLGRMAVLGFAPHLGLRFYGLGNEVIALVMSGTLLGLGALRGRVRLWGVPILIAVTFCLSSPWLGANLCGVFVGVPTVICYWAAETRRWTRSWWAIPGMLCLIVFYYLTDRLLGGTTHYSRAVNYQGLPGILSSKITLFARMMVNPLIWLGLAGMLLLAYLSLWRRDSPLRTEPALYRTVGVILAVAVFASLASDLALLMGILLCFPAAVAYLWAVGHSPVVRSVPC